MEGVERPRSLCRSIRMESEDERFQFGPATSWRSKHRVGLELCILGFLCRVWFSVVDGDCPPLFARQCMSLLGMLLSCEDDTLGSTILNLSREPVVVAGNLLSFDL